MSVPPPPPPPSLALPPPPRPLYKQRSWSPSSPSDMYSDEAWLRRKGAHRISRTSSLSSITDDDLDELKACIELGLVFDSPDSDHRKLSDTLPALGLYYASKKQYNDSVSTKNNTPTLTPSASSVSECDVLSPVGSPNAIFEPGENPQLVKTRLKQWAQVVACMVRMRHSK